MLQIIYQWDKFISTTIRNSMATLTPHFCANRTVIDYVEKFYFPTTKDWYKCSENKGMVAKQLLDWEYSLNKNWDKLRLRKLMITSNKKNYLFEIEIFLDQLHRKEIEVQLFSESLIKKRGFKGAIENTTDGCIYQAQVPLNYNASCFTPRAVPFHPEVFNPLEASQTLWKS